MLNRTLVINIHTFTGEYINLNLPVEFVKRLIDNNCFDFFFTRPAVRLLRSNNKHYHSEGFFLLLLPVH
mgnify:CR=1 FL=1